jgi:hypothetical protein
MGTMLGQVAQTSVRLMMTSAHEHAHDDDHDGRNDRRFLDGR